MGPGKGHVFLHEFGKGFCNVHKSADKWVLVPKDAEGVAYLFDCGQLLRPSGQTIVFYQIYANGTVTDNDSKVVDSGAFKLALGWF
jgi:hypothetical protein